MLYGAPIYSIEGKELVYPISGSTVANMLSICRGLGEDIGDSSTGSTIQHRPGFDDHRIRKHLGYEGCAHHRAPRHGETAGLPSGLPGGYSRPYRNRRGDCETGRNPKQKAFTQSVGTGPHLRSRQRHGRSFRFPRRSHGHPSPVLAWMRGGLHEHWACGVRVQLFSTLQFVATPQITNCLCGATIGVLGNTFSRAGHGLEVVSMPPAIFVQAPDGLVSLRSLFAVLKGTMLWCYDGKFEMGVEENWDSEEEVGERRRAPGIGFFSFLFSHFSHFCNFTCALSVLYTRSSNNGVDSAKSPATKQHKSPTNNIMISKTLKFGAVDGAFDTHCLR